MNHYNYIYANNVNFVMRPSNILRKTEEIIEHLQFLSFTASLSINSKPAVNRQPGFRRRDPHSHIHKISQLTVF